MRIAKCRMSASAAARRHLPQPRISGGPAGCNYLLSGARASAAEPLLTTTRRARGQHPPKLRPLPHSRSRRRLEANSVSPVASTPGPTSSRRSSRTIAARAATLGARGHRASEPLLARRMQAPWSREIALGRHCDSAAPDAARTKAILGTTTPHPSRRRCFDPRAAASLAAYAGGESAQSSWERR